MLLLYCRHTHTNRRQREGKLLCNSHACLMRCTGSALLLAIDVHFQGLASLSNDVSNISHSWALVWLACQAQTDRLSGLRMTI